MNSLLLAAVLLGLQARTASISGIVTDAETSAPIPGVVIALPSAGRSTLTDSLGRYRLDGLSAGTWRLVGRRLGYASWSAEVLLPEDATLEFSFALRSEPIEVPPIEVQLTGSGGRTAASSLAPAELGGTIRRISSSDLTAHPLLSEPDYFVGLSGGAVLVAPEAPDGVHLQGGSADQVDYVLDGIPLLNPYHAGGTFSAWNPDLVSVAELTTSPFAGGDPGVLGGTLVGRTRMAGTAVETQGSLSASHTRVRLSTPIGSNGAGVLLGLRTGFTGLLAHQKDLTYLDGGNHDGLAKVETPAWGGQLFLLTVFSDDGVGASVRTTPSAATAGHHEFGWNSHSFGAGWSGPLRGHLVQVRGWYAASNAESDWFATSGLQELASSRNDLGLSASLVMTSLHSSTSVGVRLVQSGTDYRLRSAAASPLSLNSGQLNLTESLEHQRAFGPSFGAKASLVASQVSGQTLLGPTAGLWWKPSQTLSVSVGVSRRHQFIQSLRNPESVVGTVFPVELPIAAGRGGIGTARSDQGSVGFDFAPSQELRIGLRGYIRKSTDLALVAAQEPGPFATGQVGSGSALTRGASLELEGRWPHARLLAIYGLQHTRISGNGLTYQPSASVPHTIDAGLTLYPASNWTLRLGFSGQFGRRATAVRAPFEWEGCNLKDRGCEFAGTPELVGPLGGVALPAYLRADLSLRYQWRLSLFGRTGSLGTFGTLTNLLDRSNLLTVMVDPATGSRDPVEMRTRSALAAGLDWVF